MTANGDYITVVNMDRDLITTVSQEFVLQFYTIMNKHPGSLHRFYKEESTLVRDDVYAQGQHEIHKYYMNLELTNCKAVVLSLDAVKSHGKSILIQVTGEIANNGCDLRRFMQSFLLVEQDLGNFYVLNDIFRYQDQTFKVEDVEEPPMIEHEHKNEDIHGEINSWTEIKNCELNNEPISQSPQLIEHEEGSEEFINYNIMSEEKDISIEIPTEIDSSQDIGQKMEELTIKEKSWAAIINPMGNRPSKPTAPVAPQPQTTKPSVQQKQINSNGDNIDKRKQQQQAQRFNNVNVKPQSALNYPDEHQLFVGNLPQNMTEDELKEFFSTKYGTVKDVRIQKSRTSNEGKPLPNFGFLVFHNHEVVEEILKHKPIYYSSHRLNVEQKMGNSRATYKAGRR